MILFVILHKRTLELVSIHKRITLTLGIRRGIKGVLVDNRQVPIMSLPTLSSYLVCQLLLQFLSYFQLLLSLGC